MAKLTDTVFVPDPRDRVLIPVAGTMDLKSLVFTLGQVVRLTRDNGRMAKGTASEWKPVDVGFIVENGLRDSRDVMVSDNLPHLRRDTKVHGPVVFRMVTVPRPTLIVVPIKDNGFEV